MLMTIAARPPDIPLSHPACTGLADLPLPVAAGIAGLVSACHNPPAYAPDVVVISNLSDDVLDIWPAGASQPALRAYYPVSNGRLPSGARIETYAQNESIRELQPPAGAILLPVGGQVIATQDGPIQLMVRVDLDASAVSFAAQLMTGYVVDNRTAPIPAAIARSYELSIAGCVNGAQALWPDLYKQPSADAAITLQTALSTILACQDLQKKVSSDHAEELSAAATHHRLTDQALAADLTRVADAAGQAGWESHLGKLAQAAVTLAGDLH